MKTWIIQAATIKTLAKIYEVSPRVFKNHLKVFENEIGEIIGRYLTAKQVGISVDKLGPPPNVDIVYPAIIQKEVEKCKKSPLKGFTSTLPEKKMAA
jgi:hypothetical protein